MNTLQARLPKNVPEPIYVQRMLDEEICLVCNREAPKDSEPWKRIQELLTKRKEDQSQNGENKPSQDFSDELKKLYQNGLALETQMGNINNDIQKTFQDLDNLTRKRTELAKALEEYESKVKSLISDANLDVKTANDLINEHQQNTEYAKRFRDELYNNKYKIDKKNDELKSVEEELSNLSTGDFPEWLSNKMDIVTTFQEIAQSTRERVFEDLVKTLEEEANQHYYEMTKDNLSVRGYIKLKPTTGGNYMPSLVDEEGNRLQQLNMGNIILIKLATIMAIVSARQGSRDTELYTLISDAPTSVFGEDYTIGFCKTVSKVYKQSIIMSKEFYKNKELRDELFQNEEINLGKAYMITPTIDESERTDRTNLATNIKELN